MINLLAMNLTNYGLHGFTITSSSNIQEMMMMCSSPQLPGRLHGQLHRLPVGHHTRERDASHHFS